jgi:hypothetical protein
MDNTKHPVTQTGRIPVLFDIVERGENSPPEDKIQQPPPPEVSEFHLDNIAPDSETPTELPIPENDVTAFSLVESENITAEIPVIPESIPATDSTEFTLSDRQSITEEIAFAPPDMPQNNHTDPDELIQQAMQEIMPQLEVLVRQTLYRLTHPVKKDKDTDQTK